MTAPIRSMPEVNIVQQMVGWCRIAKHARCRISQWKLTDGQALQLSVEMSSTWGISPSIMYESLCSGNATVLGARVTVR